MLLHSIQQAISPRAHYQEYNIKKRYVGDSPTRKKSLMNANPHFITSERIAAGGRRDKNGDYPTNISLPTGESTPRTRDVEATEIKTSSRELRTLQSSRSPQTPLTPHTPWHEIMQSLTSCRQENEARHIIATFLRKMRHPYNLSSLISLDSCITTSSKALCKISSRNKH